MMIWQTVESSQIEQVGYDAETETLGIRFKPTKKQQEAKQPGGEYHYANASDDLFGKFVAAESVGKFFDRHIKSQPELYPFRKVETAVDAVKITNNMEAQGPTDAQKIVCRAAGIDLPEKATMADASKLIGEYQAAHSNQPLVLR